MPRIMYAGLCLFFCLVLLACNQDEVQGKAAQKIGIVNINRIMVESEAGKAAAKYVEGLQNGMRGQLTALQKKAEKIEKEEGDAKKASEENLQKEVQMIYAKMQAEQQNVQNILNDVLHRTVENFRKSRGYSLILFSDVALSFEESADITKEITAEMNKEKVEFKPLNGASRASAPAAKEGNDGQGAAEQKAPEQANTK